MKHRWLPVLALASLLGCEFDLGRARQKEAEPSEPRLVSTAVVPPTPAPPSQVQPPAGAPRSFADLAATADPAVVFVHRKDRKRFTDGFHVYEEKVDSGTGSGFVFDAAQGLVLTNNHVVGGAAEVTVELADGRSLPARPVGFDPLTDVAVIRITADGLHALELGDSDATRVGDWVLALGNPLGLSHTVSAGIVSGRDRSQTDPNNPRAYVNYLQTDAAINPGNSGGPLIDMGGRVVGINSAIIGGANTIGFAIPINMVRELLPRLLAEGRVTRAVIGVELGERQERGGALIAGVVRNGPAHEAGFLPGDIALRVGDHVIDSPERLRWWISLAEVGKPLDVLVRRGDRELTLSVKPWPSEPRR